MMALPRPLKSGLAVRGMWAIWLILGICCLIETVLQLADHDLLGSRLWRPLSYQYGGFWAGLLAGWQPNFAAQPAAMFFTYQFLHAGFGHLIGNMAALVWLGALLLPGLGGLRFAGLYLASAIGGAAMFGALSSSAAPMVGASGALFGLAGAWIVQDWRRTRRPPAEGGHGPRAARVWVLQMVVFLLLVNLLSWLLQGGALAWETHLGGALTGAGLALAMRDI